MLADRYRTVVESGGDRTTLEALYAPDALLDANVITWRFQRKGLDEIAAQYADWYADGGATIEDLTEWSGEWGSVVECVERGSMAGQPFYSRTLSVLVVAGDRVVKHVYYCTGPWDAPTEARQKVEAPMYEP